MESIKPEHCFTTKEGRAAYFNTLERDPREVARTAWISHAKAVRLGMWGQDNELLYDCARICRAELQAALRVSFPVEWIFESEVFRWLYIQARVQPEREFVGMLEENLGARHPLVENLRQTSRTNIDPTTGLRALDDMLEGRGGAKDLNFQLAMVYKREIDQIPDERWRDAPAFLLNLRKVDRLHIPQRKRHPPHLRLIGE